MYVYVDDVSLVEYMLCTVGLSAAETSGPSVFPNPFSNKLNVSSATKAPAKFRLYDLTRTFLVEETFEENLELRTDQLEPGLYYYEVFESGVITGRGKLLKK